MSLAIALLATATLAAPQYRLTLLPVTNPRVATINEAGDIAASSLDGPVYMIRSGQIVALAESSPFTHGVGRIAGGKLIFADYSSNSYASRVWSGDRTQALPELEGYSPFVQAAVGDDLYAGIVSRGPSASADPDESSDQGYVYSKASGYRLIPELLSRSTKIEAMTSAGAIAGYMTPTIRSEPEHQAFFWSAASGFHLLAMPLAGDTYGRDVNDNGWVVGLYHTLSPGMEPSLRRGFLWKPELGSWSIDKLSPGSIRPTAINNRRDVVGSVQSTPPGPSSTEHAFYWSPGQDRVEDLNMLVQAPGVHLSYAHDVNDKGSIVATGTLEGQSRLFLLERL